MLLRLGNILIKVSWSEISVSPHLLEWLLRLAPLKSVLLDADLVLVVVVLVVLVGHLSKYVLASFSMGMFLMRLVGPRGTLQVGQVLI